MQARISVLTKVAAELWRMIKVFPRLTAVFSLCIAASVVTACKEPPLTQKAEQTPFLLLTGNETQIVSVNIERVRLLSIFESARSAILENQERNERWSRLVETIGIDPVRSIDRVVIGNQGDIEFSDPFKNAVVLANGTFDDPQQIVDGFLAIAGENYLLSPPPFYIRESNGVSIYTTSAPKYKKPDEIVEFNFAFPTPKLMIFTQSTERMDNALQILQGQKPGIQASEDWKKRLSPINVGAMIWSVGDIPQSVKKYLRERVASEPELRGLNALANGLIYTAAVEVGRDDYRARVRISCDSIGAATDMAEHVKAARAILPRVFTHYLGEGHPKIADWLALSNEVYISNEFSSVVLTLDKSRRSIEDFVRKITSPTPTPTPREIPAPFLQSN